MRATPVFLRIDTDQERASHLLYEIPIATTDLGSLCVIIEGIQRVFFSVQRSGTTLPSQFLRLEAFGITETEKGVTICLITPRATVLNNYISGGSVGIDEIMFFSNDIGRIVSGISSLGMTGVVLYEDLYVRKDPSSHVPTLCVSPVVFILPLLLQQMALTGTQSIAPEVYNGIADSRILSWSIGVVMYRIIKGNLPYKKYIGWQAVDVSDIPNDLVRDAVGRLLEISDRRVFPENINEVELFRISNGWKMFRSGDVRRYVKSIEISQSKEKEQIYGGQNAEGLNVVIWEAKSTELINIVKEARVLRLCESIHISNVIDVCVDNDKVYLVTEGSNCGTLENYVEYRRKTSGLSKDEIEYFSREIIKAVKYLRFEKGVIVQDLRLSDFLLTANPGGIPFVKMARCRSCRNARECEGRERSDLKVLGEVLREITGENKMEITNNGGIVFENKVVEGLREVVQLIAIKEEVDWDYFLKDPFVGALTAAPDILLGCEEKIDTSGCLGSLGIGNQCGLGCTKNTIDVEMKNVVFNALGRAIY
ncbi:hypothetical protein EIN_130750 [Entamoeba invadens IP1]|uniref:Protein kinase domain-containing protein n=1 Tax=Entamoeba invadens IP1 TaxID=370355 RepID=A0A0A1UD13_ENTIV|nr:hypothetical protein EIN_130750 [Entamoeba invadens IP1]ELP94316.1 hypothetical protein EIN_130750 [Entamoeba invadens IP1]|eukprot:XP_004261087.1 hypothetical protein EIN_130750 [Entamoeba invadens IP1]